MLYNNKRGQEMSPIGLMMGIVGFFAGLLMAKQMDFGMVKLIFTAILSGVCGYIVSTVIANK